MTEPARHDAVWTGESLREPRGAAPRPVPLRLVADGGHLISPPSGQPADVRPRSVRTAPGQRSGAPRPAVRTNSLPGTPVRLTRRGRIAVTVAAVLAIGAASLALAGAAQATGHGGAPATAGAHLTKVEVRPGQSLWSVAEAYDPGADTRVVIQEILQMNSLTSDQVQPGQVLWVPRG